MPDNGGGSDPVELMLEKTGCINLHYKVQVGGVALCKISKSVYITPYNISRNVLQNDKIGESVRTLYENLKLVCKTIRIRNVLSTNKNESSNPAN